MAARHPWQVSNISPGRWADEIGSQPWPQQTAPGQLSSRLGGQPGSPNVVTPYEHSDDDIGDIQQYQYQYQVVNLQQTGLESGGAWENLRTRQQHLISWDSYLLYMMMMMKHQANALYSNIASDVSYICSYIIIYVHSLQIFSLQPSAHLIQCGLVLLFYGKSKYRKHIYIIGSDQLQAGQPYSSCDGPDDL